MNTLKTTLLLGSLTGLIISGGYFWGGQNGALFALIISALMNFVSYWFSDKIVLAMYGAKEISEQENPRLYGIIQELTKKDGLPMPKIYKVNLPVPNAFATGRNEKHSAVAVTEGILGLLDEKELRGVLAHELSHVKNRDILISSVAATLAGAISYLAQMAYWGGMFFGGDRQSRDRENVFGLLAFVILSPLIATLLHLALSRSREYGADKSGAQLCDDPLSLAAALQKLDLFSKNYPLAGTAKNEATSHLFIVNPFKPSLLLNLFSTHPPIEERVARLKQMAKNKK